MQDGVSTVRGTLQITPKPSRCVRDGDNCEIAHSRGDGRLGVVDRDDVIGNDSPGGGDNKYDSNTTSRNNNKKDTTTESSKFTHSSKRGDRFQCIGRRRK